MYCGTVGLGLGFRVGSSLKLSGLRRPPGITLTILKHFPGYSKALRGLTKAPKAFAGSHLKSAGM